MSRCLLAEWTRWNAQHLFGEQNSRQSWKLNVLREKTKQRTSSQCLGCAKLLSETLNFSLKPLLMLSRMLYKLFCFIWDGAWPSKALKIYGKRLLFNDVMRCISNKKCCFFLGMRRNLTWTHFFSFFFCYIFRFEFKEPKNFYFMVFLNARH